MSKIKIAIADDYKIYRDGLKVSLASDDNLEVVLEADNGDDLVSIDISDPNSIKVLKRIEKAFPYPSYPNERGKFECVDPSKGYVKAWEYVELINPKCFR